MKVLRQLANWKCISPLVVLFLVFGGYLLPTYQAKMDAVAQKAVPALDMRIGGYTFAEVQSSFEQLGEEGRAIYAFAEYPLDVIYPIVYGLLLVLIILALLKRLVDVHSKWNYLIALPIFVVVVDFGENFTILQLLEQFPEIGAGQVAFANQLSQLKWVGVGASLLTVLVLGVVVLLRRRQSLLA